MCDLFPFSFSRFLHFLQYKFIIKFFHVSLFPLFSSFIIVSFYDTSNLSEMYDNSHVLFTLPPF